MKLTYTTPESTKLKHYFVTALSQTFNGNLKAENSHAMTFGHKSVNQRRQASKAYKLKASENAVTVYSIP